MKLDEIKAVLEKELKPGRFKHSLGVMTTAVELAVLYDVSPEQAELAGLLHDCARIYQDDTLVSEAAKAGVKADEIEIAAPILLHAPLGAILAEQKFGINDEAIKRAIRLHTTGGRQMTKLDKIIYLADMIEPNRVYPKLEQLREAARLKLDEAMLLAFNQSISYVIAKNQLVHLDTIAARNELLLNR